MLKLRQYQKDWVRDIYAAWERVHSVMAVLPTGGGKTVCFAAIMHDHNGAAAAVVHRKEIVGQISLSLAALEVPHRLIAPKDVVAHIRRKHLKTYGRSWVDPHALAGVVSVQTLTSRGAANNRELQAWVGQITLAVFDEGHHYVTSGYWARAVELLTRARLLLVTATPRRLDGKGLGSHADGFADKLVEGPTPRELIEQGYLCPYAYLSPTGGLNAGNLPLTPSGEVDKKALRAWAVESHLVGSVVGHYQKHTPGKQAIVFATDVKTAGEMADEFQAAGIKAMAVSGETDTRPRDKAVDDFTARSIQVLVNVDLFDEGFDVPGAEVCVMARPTESLAKFLQMAGRVLRPVYADGFDLSTAEGRRAAIAAGPKPQAVILDAVRNWERGHLLPDWPRVWSLDAQIKGAARSEAELLRACTFCSQPYERFLSVCPYCFMEHQPAARQQIVQVDGDLAALDVDALAAVLERVRAANMAPDEYAADQIARRIPDIGRGADMRRHKVNLYRRGVLRELIAWWVGLQPPDRALAEKHRRFYLRFGYDIANAHTLKAADTDQLIQRIAEGFHRDL